MPTRQRRLLRELVRYLLAGSLAFLVDLFILIQLKEKVGVNVLIANIFSFGAGLAMTYVLSICWVFEFRRLRSFLPEFGIFTLIALFGFATNEFCLWVASYGFGAHYTLAKIYATGFTFMLNFTLRKLILFRQSDTVPK